MGGRWFRIRVGESGVAEEKLDGLADEGVFCSHGDLTDAVGDCHGDFSEVVEESDESVALVLEFHYV